MKYVSLFLISALVSGAAWAGPQQSATATDHSTHAAHAQPQRLVGQPPGRRQPLPQQGGDVVEGALAGERDHLLAGRVGLLRRGLGRGVEQGEPRHALRRPARRASGPRAAAPPDGDHWSARSPATDTPPRTHRRTGNGPDRGQPRHPPHARSPPSGTPARTPRNRPHTSPPPRATRRHGGPAASEPVPWDRRSSRNRVSTDGQWCRRLAWRSARLRGRSRSRKG